MRYAHTNIVARDWKKLAQFYVDVFACQPVYPERDLYGEWIDKTTGINNVRIKGIHLRLPGYENGPTLEIFEYLPDNLRNYEPVINMQGFAHIAFEVDSVEDVLQNLLKNGGSQLGEVIIKEYENIGILTVVYTRDPEGNFIEIQNWKK